MARSKRIQDSHRQSQNRLRRLVIVLGDQLDRSSPALRDFDPDSDVVWMAEVDQESTHVWTHRARIALFLASMRHLRDELVQRGWTVCYRELGSHDHPTLESCLRADLERLRPQVVRLVEPGEWRVRDALTRTCSAAATPIEYLPDSHFLLSTEDFAAWARDRRELRLEHFYRFMRRRTGILMHAREPAGGAWNFDRANRDAFGRDGPDELVQPIGFEPDRVTTTVIECVATRFAEHPGSLDHFDWPVTPADAEHVLEDFVASRLPRFGRWQDAMWSNAPYLYHSRLSAAMNLKLISPHRVVDAAVAAYERGDAPIEAVEGFVRQILGWREFVRGVYWLQMPRYLDSNALQADADLPAFYWSADTDMACVREVVRQTLDRGYAHHIQRLMVTGLFALLLGVRPREVHEWYLAVYVDAVEWVELPNTLGMSQYADGGVVGSKPYVATGKYIDRMSNYCRNCRYDPAQATGERACPFTTLYWDFLGRHERRFEKHPRMALQVRNLKRLDRAQRRAIRQASDQLRTQFARAS